MAGKDGEKPIAFDLDQFLPYLLNQAAERTSKRFEVAYRESYGISRTQWRILANLGSYGDMTAADVSRRSHTEKSKLSRAVSALEAEGLLRREQSASDRRTERLQLTESGRAVFENLSARAADFDHALRWMLGPERAKLLEDMLRILAERDE